MIKKALVITLALSTLGLPSYSAASESSKTRFDAQGIVRLPKLQKNGSWQVARQCAITHDGSLVVIGQNTRRRLGETNAPYGSRYAVARISRTGNIAKMFGGRTWSFLPGSGSSVRLLASAIDSVGRSYFVLHARKQGRTGRSVVNIRRLAADGRLDSSFGRDGTVRLRLPLYTPDIRLFPVSSGRLLVTSRRFQTTRVYLFDERGRPSAEFSGGGETTILDFSVTSAAETNTGFLLAGGSQVLALAPNGGMLPGFGTGGRLQTPVSTSPDGMRIMAIARSGADRFAIAVEERVAYGTAGNISILEYKAADGSGPVNRSSKLQEVMYGNDGFPSVTTAGLRPVNGGLALTYLETWYDAANVNMVNLSIYDGTDAINTPLAVLNRVFATESLAVSPSGDRMYLCGSFGSRFDRRQVTVRRVVLP
jgi:hypothetical protein